jgi:hypothetical protein
MVNWVEKEKTQPTYEVGEQQRLCRAHVAPTSVSRCRRKCFPVDCVKRHYTPKCKWKRRHRQHDGSDPSRGPKIPGDPWCADTERAAPTVGCGRRVGQPANAVSRPPMDTPRPRSLPRWHRIPLVGLGATTDGRYDLYPIMPTLPDRGAPWRSDSRSDPERSVWRSVGGALAVEFPGSGPGAVVQGPQRRLANRAQVITQQGDGGGQSGCVLLEIIWHLVAACRHWQNQAARQPSSGCC